MKNWKDVYQLPLRLTDFTWVYDSKENFVFQFLSSKAELQEKIIKLLNGEIEIQGKTSKFIYKDGYIQTDEGRKLILIRGWGNLTGGGAMNLSYEEAKNIQDTFAEYILSRFNSAP